MNRNWIKIASIFIGTVIGAGFASGREIIEFFAVYGVFGLIGMVIVMVMFSILGSLLLLKIKKLKVENFNELSGRIFNRKINKLIQILILLSLYSGFSIMVAGSGAVFKEELGLPANLGIIVMVALSFIVFIFDLEGIAIINEILVPILIIGIVSSSLGGILKGDFQIANTIGLAYTSKGNFFTSSLLYFGTNSLVLLVVFSSLLPIIDSKSTGVKASFAAGSILGLLGLLILTAILIHYNDVRHLEIPMLKIASFLGEKNQFFYSIILWIAIFTTALANGFGFLNNISKNNWRISKIILFCLSSIPIAKMGFGNLISILYPIFGLIGFFMFILVLLK